MSNKTFNAKNNKAKKGISPVIATVILVAVAVVIAAALAGFSSSLFGTYSSAGAAVTVRSVTMNVDGVGSVSLQNDGNIDDQLLSVSTVGFAPANPTNGVPSTTFKIAPHGGQLSANFDITGNSIFDAGQIVTVKLVMKSGAQLTQSVVVTQ